MYFLENKRIGLRALEIRDIDGGYQNWLNDSKVCEFNSHHRYITTREELQSYVESLRNNRNAIVCAIDYLPEKKHIGNISLQAIDLINRCAEVAFILGEREYWGKGIAMEAAELLINHGFMQLGLTRIYFGTSSENIGMQKVGEKLGFTKEGVRREAMYKNGKYYDIYEYGLLAKEWKY